MGMLFAVILGSYFFTVSAAVQQEKVELREVWERGLEFFYPVLSVLFAFFLINIASSMVFPGEQATWLRMIISLLITVLLNPIPEVIYIHPGSLGEMFGRSFEFIRENFIEWFLPAGILLLPFSIINFDLMLTLLLELSTKNPFLLLESVIQLFSVFVISPGSLFSTAPLLLIFMALMYFIFVFRGCLYQKLATSTRRKRIYSERHQ